MNVYVALTITILDRIQKLEDILTSVNNYCE